MLEWWHHSSWLNFTVGEGWDKTHGGVCLSACLEEAVGCMLCSSGQSLDGDADSVRSPTGTTHAKEATNARPLRHQDLNGQRNKKKTMKTAEKWSETQKGKQRVMPRGKQGKESFEEVGLRCPGPHRWQISAKATGSNLWEVTDARRGR